MPVCWNCQASVGGEHFCPACGKVLPPAPETDFFTFLELPLKLNLEAADLEKRFYALSRKLHPDNFARASAKEQQFSLEQSAVLNDAYRTLKDPAARGEYLLALSGHKLNANNRQAPSELLDEVFELNELLAEWKKSKPSGCTSGNADAADRRSKLEAGMSKLVQREKDFYDELLGLYRQWDQAMEEGKLDIKKEVLLDRLSGILSHRNYLQNLIRNVKEALQ